MYLSSGYSAQPFAFCWRLEGGGTLKSSLSTETVKVGRKVSMKSDLCIIVSRIIVL